MFYTCNQNQTHFVDKCFFFFFLDIAITVLVVVVLVQISFSICETHERSAGMGMLITWYRFSLEVFEQYRGHFHELMTRTAKRLWPLHVHKLFQQTAGCEDLIPSAHEMCCVNMKQLCCFCILHFMYLPKIGLFGVGSSQWGFWGGFFFINTFLQHIVSILATANITVASDVLQTYTHWLMFISCFLCKNMGCFSLYECCAKNISCTSLFAKIGTNYPLAIVSMNLIKFTV